MGKSWKTNGCLCWVSALIGSAFLRVEAARAEGAPTLGPVDDAGNATAQLTWSNSADPPLRFLGYAYDWYGVRWVPNAEGGALFHPFDASATSGQIDTGASGAYFVWIANQYASGGVYCCANPWIGILYSGAPHAPLGALAQLKGGTPNVRLHWKPDPYGTWHYQIIVYRMEDANFVASAGPGGTSLWHFVDYGQVGYSPGEADFFQGWADFSLPPGSYWFFIRGVGWLSPFPAGDYATAHIAVPEQLAVNLPGGAPLDLVRIPAGNPKMGSPDTERNRHADEGPQHSVTFFKGFYLGKFQVTQKQWQAVMGTMPAKDYGVGDDYPVYYVTWDNCQQFIAALNQLGQGTFRLPSEAEWEYACRAGTETRFFFGDSLVDANGAPVDDNASDAPAGMLPGNRSDYMWYAFNSDTPTSGTKPVGLKLPNQFGLFDMCGNLSEWVQDWYHTDYAQPGCPDDGSAWDTPQPGQTNRVCRGGDWLDYARFARSANRGSDKDPAKGYPYVGFRVARSLD
ncbi:MAG: formylglycine-generating enzyme family protein [Candidatus Sumerlaeota bacterium]|nr:formylglycine-generating enzyme family protein [Candidatus Sumerlaeota bacterium]